VDAQAQRSPSVIKRAVKRSTVIVRLVQINPTEAEDSFMRQRVPVTLLAVSVLAVPAAPADAQAIPSCVGQFASTFAREDGAAFGADISFGARFASQPNFGAGVVAPFAHEPRDACP
jgi:hypothetical protein